MTVGPRFLRSDRLLLPRSDHQLALPHALRTIPLSQAVPSSMPSRPLVQREQLRGPVTPSQPNDTAMGIHHRIAIFGHYERIVLAI